MKKFYLFLLLAPLLSIAQIHFTTNVLTDQNSGFQGADGFELIDVDNDGDKDIFAYKGSSLVVFERLANGQFSKPLPINTPFQTSFTAKMGDLNGDNLPDLVIITSNSISWMPNTGSFTNFTVINVISTNNVPNSVQIIDRDADGDQDIFFYDTFNSGWFINNSNATSFTYSSYFGSSVFDILVQDVNGDNAADFISKASDGEYNLRFTVYDATATNSYNFIETIDGFAVGGYPALGDLDGDGDNDLAYAYLNGTARQLVWYQYNSATGLFGTKTVIANLTTDPSGVYVGNVNSNGAADIVLTYNDPDKISWVRSNGNGSFAAEQTITTAANLVRQVLIADADGDTFNDIFFTSYYDSKLSYLKTNGAVNPTFTEVRLNNATFGAFSVEAGDMDNDGDRDIVQASLIERKISWFKNENGAFSGNQNIIQEFETYAPYSLRLTDIDNDGDKDILYFSTWEPNLSNASELVLLKNSNNGTTFTKSIVYSVTEEITSYELLDVDTDGDKDLVVGNNGNLMYLFKNNGNGTFATPTQFSEFLFNRAPGLFAVADFDNDGDTDIATGRSDGEVSWFVNEGGNFTQKNVVLAPNNLNYSIKAADIDNDGDQDLIYENYSPNRIGVFKNQGLGVFAAPVLIDNSIFRPRGLNAVDLELDGDLDLVCGSENSIIVAYLNDGNGNFGSEITISNEPAATRDIATTDFTGDGLPDFAIASYNDDSIVWLENRGLTTRQINGKVQYDADSNGCTTQDYGVVTKLVQATDSNFSLAAFTSAAGTYQLNLSDGNYTLSLPNTATHFGVSPLEPIVQLNDALPAIESNFCITPAIATEDLEISLYPTNSVRAGFDHQLKMIVKNVGSVEKNAAIKLYHPANKLLFQSAEPQANASTAGVLEFTISNLQPLTERLLTVNFTVAVIPIVNLDEIVNIGVEIDDSAGDATPDNNGASVNQSVIASYDPNDITVFEGATVPIENANNYLHYRIRFENTGNTYADRVVIKTTLDSDLDWSTLQPEGASHNYFTTVRNGNEVTFTFNAIYLPAASQNLAAAQGYVLFKIKPKNTVVVGTEVTAMAAIFFDFNPPIITNTATTTFVNTALDVDQVAVEKMVLYPNPVDTLLRVSPTTDWQEIELIDVTGKTVVRTKAFPINTENLAPGMYILKATTTSGQLLVRKVVKR